MEITDKVLLAGQQLNLFNSAVATIKIYLLAILPSTPPCTQPSTYKNNSRIPTHCTTSFSTGGTGRSISGPKPQRAKQESKKLTKKVRVCTD